MSPTKCSEAGLAGLLDSKEDQYSSIDQEEQENEALDFHNRRPSRPANAFCKILIVVLCLTNLLTGWSLFQSRRHAASVVDEEGELPPFMAAIDRRLYIERFNHFNFNTTSRYTDKADEVGDQVELNWIDLGTNVKPVVLPYEDAPHYRMHKEHVTTDSLKKDGVLVNPPVAGYPVQLQSMHWLHCLNILRHGQWYNEEYAKLHHPSFSPPEQKLSGASPYTYIELHSAHCIDQLRQLIMCEADVRLVPYVYHADGSGISPDFGQERRCRNFEAVVEWHEEHKWLEWGEGNGTPSPREHERYYSWTGYRNERKDRHSRN